MDTGNKIGIGVCITLFGVGIQEALIGFLGVALLLSAVIDTLGLLLPDVDEQ